MNFSAVILAGGKSSRMGRDKAFVEIGGQTLLARQLELVRAIGATEVFISGRSPTDYSQFGCRVLTDGFSEAGPLAGIERALAVSAARLVLVLAVDLPELDAALLRDLAAQCQSGCGVVPRVAGQLEPLVAVYPQPTHALARSRLERGSHAVKDFASDCAAAGLVQFIDLPASAARHFANWNTPAGFSAQT